MKKTRTFVSHVAVSISLITCIAYLPSLRSEFVEWDDIHYVVQNPHIRTFDMSFFRWAFFDFYVANWHPITWMSHGLDYAVWGLNPLGHHLTNIILHGVNTFLVVLLAMTLIETAKETSGECPSFLRGRMVLIASGVAGALFGLHPLHVESVAWVSERKDLLCAMFFLLSVMAYTRHAYGKTNATVPRGFSDKYYLLSIGFFILALLSKPMAVSLPAVLLILDWHPFKRIRSLVTFRSEFVWKLPFFILSLVSSLLTIFAQKSGNALTSLRTAPWSVRLLVSAKSLVAYLSKMIMPLNLSPYYPYPKEVSFFSLEYLIPVALVVGITLTCVVIAKKQRVWLSTWCYFVVTLIPVIGIVKVGTQSMADRYTYLPSFGPFLVFGLAAAWSWGKVNVTKRWAFTLKAAIAVAAVSAFVFLSAETQKQIGVWKDNYSLWSYVVEKEPDEDYMPYMNLGVALFRMGRLDGAKENLEKAVALDPRANDAYMNLGIVYGKMGRLDKAMENLEKAVALDPRADDAYMNLGIVYGKMGDFQEAKKNFNRAIALNPTSREVYYNLGILYDDSGLYGEAIDCFNKVIFLDQHNGAAYFGRGSLYLRTGDMNRAVPDFRKACTLDYKDGCKALRFLGIEK